MAGTLLDKLTKVTDADFAKYLIAYAEKEIIQLIEEEDCNLSDYLD